MPARSSIVTQQNLATTSTEALAQEGKAVRLIWKRQHELSVADGERRSRRRTTRHEESEASGARRDRGARHRPRVAAAAGRRRRAPQASLGDGEGELNLVIWAGYAERGDVDPAYDWVTPFEEETGCKVNTTDMTDSNNGVSLMQSGDYDGGSFSGDATDRLMAGGIVAPVNTALIPNYANIFEGLKNKAHNSLDGVPYGVPHGRGPNLLMYNTDVVTEPPTIWDLVWDGGADGAGKVSVYDSSIYIADAALHLKDDAARPRHHQPVSAQRGAVRRRDRPAREAARCRGPVLGHATADQIASYARGRRHHRDVVAVHGRT